jgi:uncharacterized protein (DUF4415 family)
MVAGPASRQNTTAEALIFAGSFCLPGDAEMGIKTKPTKQETEPTTTSYERGLAPAEDELTNMHSVFFEERQPTQPSKHPRQAVVAKLRIGPDLIEFFREDELAALLCVTVRTLRRWHSLRTGPPRTVISRAIYYRKQAVLEWLLAKEERLPARRSR